MDKKFGHKLKDLLLYVTAFMKWVGVSVVTGLICGALGVLMHIAVDSSAEVFDVYPFFIYLLPVLGLLIVGVYRLSRIDPSVGTDDVLRSVQSDKPISPLLAPIILLSSALTHLGGGSSGREGAALQIGGSIACGIGRLMRFKPEDRRIITMCGMSAVFSAAFGTPMAAAVFCVEVVSVGIMRSSAFMPCILSSFSAYLLSGFLGVSPMRLDISSVEFGVWSAAQAVILGLLCALLSLLLCQTMHVSKKWFKRLIPNPYIRIAIGGAIIAGLTLISGSHDYNGSGLRLISTALDTGDVFPWAFLLKLLFTAITLGSGFKGGEIVPTLAIGALFGAAFSPIIGLAPEAGAGIAMVAVFCGSVNCPLASLLLGLELFSGSNIFLIAIACAVSFMVTGKSSLFTAQEFLFSKLDPIPAKTDKEDASNAVPVECQHKKSE